MPAIVSVSTEMPPYEMNQQETRELVYDLFSASVSQIDRLIKIFDHSGIDSRQFMAPKSWYLESHTFAEKNALYVDSAVDLGVKAIRSCLKGTNERISCHLEEIDAFIYISSSGISTPTIDAKIMNKLSFSPHVKRIPIWGLGCAGGAAGLSRAYDFCKAYPKAKVLVLCTEFCSLTFAKDDRSKSNLVGTSLFGDGVACALVAGDQVDLKENRLPYIEGTQSTFMPDSEDIMGWDLQEDGLHVIFSRDIPNVIEKWLKPNVEMFLSSMAVEFNDINAFVAHPGGKKVLTAYEFALGYTEEMTELPRKVLRSHGNMSSPTVLYVLKEFMEQSYEEGEKGLLTALGPGFSSELLLLNWRTL
ncbi:type III polyketide synthase [Salipaludibacillus keqinensis]|uniref:Type III polyketide synthase n=1 Tax=Salipaludibacillus keqinensis TaxID=2045207 RepID=A0A323THW2_9BACI|nr:3-oxoacyl-[acyl-carrier-protein] synthase III C-terminal domain-containing protein [Salipaludibacillus keqinensis]PYZ92223.1 type III polyketide synthase [Salipaludibacillus keqinensis]